MRSGSAAEPCGVVIKILQVERGNTHGLCPNAAGQVIVWQEPLNPTLAGIA